MASYTSFLNLEKPTTSERLDVLKINSNWDKIDAGVSTLNSQVTARAKAARQSWGTTLTAENFGQGLLIINYTSAYIVWYQGTSNISVRSLRTSDGTKTGSGSVSFGADDVNGTDYTITRNGTSFSLEASANSTMSLIYT